MYESKTPKRRKIFYDFINWQNLHEAQENKLKKLHSIFSAAQ